MYYVKIILDLRILFNFPFSDNLENTGVVFCHLTECINTKAWTHFLFCKLGSFKMSIFYRILSLRGDKAVPSRKYGQQQIS